MNIQAVPPQTGTDPQKQHQSDAQEQLASALQALRGWQQRQDRLGSGRHGRCLEAVRAALAAVGLILPQPQPHPHNLALANFGLLKQNPAGWGWKLAPAGARFTLDYFDHVGRLPDGRIAGHVALTDHQRQILFSSWNYPLSPYWRANRAGSFVPFPGLTGAVSKEALPAGKQTKASPYLDAEVVDTTTGGLLRRLPACALLASDGYAYLRATALSDVVGESYTVNDAHREGILILRRGRPSVP